MDDGDGIFYRLNLMSWRHWNDHVFNGEISLNTQVLFIGRTFVLGSIFMFYVAVALVGWAVVFTCRPVDIGERVWDWRIWTLLYYRVNLFVMTFPFFITLLVTVLPDGDSVSVRGDLDSCREADPPCSDRPVRVHVKWEGLVPLLSGCVKQFDFNKVQMVDAGSQTSKLFTCTTGSQVTPGIRAGVSTQTAGLATSDVGCQAGSATCSGIETRASGALKTAITKVIQGVEKPIVSDRECQTISAVCAGVRTQTVNLATRVSTSTQVVRTATSNAGCQAVAPVCSGRRQTTRKVAVASTARQSMPAATLEVGCQISPAARPKEPSKVSTATQVMPTRAVEVGCQAVPSTRLGVSTQTGKFAKRVSTSTQVVRTATSNAGCQAVAPVCSGRRQTIRKGVSMPVEKARTAPVLKYASRSVERMSKERCEFIPRVKKAQAIVRVCESPLVPSSEVSSSMPEVLVAPSNGRGSPEGACAPGSVNRQVVTRTDDAQFQCGTARQIMDRATQIAETTVLECLMQEATQEASSSAVAERQMVDRATRAAENAILKSLLEEAVQNVRPVTVRGPGFIVDWRIPDDVIQAVLEK